ncbi:pentapeptide repeat-containing protein [Actinomadura madurae]|uniref:pentapeptide repeat-containing protein n=1 Tax=Actinomadura madurae TaxID=1993 RepID=UPI0020D20807|nr:pentapeptide repeat-containing protein [Actinomadura madurae]MCP9968918.1 pentapeptide repeat-containing protein [Actinomadura madurae]MCQ0007100.1 pentapeptide repeat-containing protein [Actinomadura madurae]
MDHLRRWTLVLVGAGALLFLAGVIVYLPRLVYPSLTDRELRVVPSAEKRIELQHARYRLQSDFRGQTFQALAGLAVALGATAAWRQIKVAREGQITDRFTSAIEHIGDGNLDVRVGGIYTLERIAENSKVDQAMIARVLVAFVRTHATWTPGSDADPSRVPLPPLDEQVPWLRDRAHDVQIALNVLGRLLGINGVRVSLNRVDLRRSDLARVHFEAASLMFTNLSLAYLRSADLSGARLDNSDLRYADMREVRLTEANLRHAHLEHADLRGADLQHAELSHAILNAADLRGANLAGARLHQADLTDVRDDETTTWPE